MKNWNASLYKEKHAFVFEYGNSLIDWLQPKAGESILDLGCGTGELTARLAASGAKVTGMDSSAAMISTASINYPNVEFVVGNATSFTLPGQYDAIFSNAALHWVREQEMAIARIYAHLKPGGRLVMEMGGKGNVSDILDALEKAMQLHGYSYQPFWYFPSVGEYTTLLEKAGFRVNQLNFFDRVTQLADPENGIIDWLQMFGNHFFEHVPEKDQLDIMQQVQHDLRPTNYRDGKWFSDYVRLRLIAVKA
jgi:trans-aconitate methyltransferase